MDVENESLDVRDAQAEKIYLQLSKNPILTETIFTASDGSIVNIAWLKHYFVQKISHLPEDERIIWILRKDKYSDLMVKCNTWKAKAYGFKKKTITNADGEEKVVKVSKNKFNSLENKKDSIIELFGKMFSIVEVHEVCTVDWKMVVSRQLLSEFRKHNSQLIQEKIEDFKRNHTDIRLGYKRSRLEELCWLYHECKRKLKQNFTRALVDTMKNLLESIKREVEGDKIVIDGNIDINIETMVNSHLKNEVLKGISLRQIIIGRVAAKMKVQPEKLIASLTNSYYSKYVSSDAEDIDFEEIDYPSSQEYDFSKIEQMQKDLKIDDLKTDKKLAEEVKASKKIATDMDLKSDLIAKLEARKNILKGKRTSLDDILSKHRL